MEKKKIGDHVIVMESSGYPVEAVVISLDPFMVQYVEENGDLVGRPFRMNPGACQLVEK